ncbi:hypothetical protein BB561_002531 [Smittium simulii]|uniref:Uncharacterized protein n=1 Tax=Smittium simulii TaxID=133385 RepID=A0A2T9YQC6_9FUNG|nr:hypothetical protein BB561_002531 [Smittium simulii]
MKKNSASGSVITDSKTIFKPVLTTPSAITAFPTLSPSNQAVLLSRLEQLIIPYKAANPFSKQTKAKSTSHKRKVSLDKDIPSSKISKTEKTETNQTVLNSRAILEQTQPEQALLFDTAIHKQTVFLNKNSELKQKKPDWFIDLKLGINQVSQALEQDIRFYETEYFNALRKSSNITNKNSNDTNSLPFVKPPNPKVAVVFCCSVDTQPAHMISHLPNLVQILNARKAHYGRETGNQLQKVSLVGLPEGSETIMSQLFGIKRISTFAVCSDSGYFDALTKFIAGVIPAIESFNGFNIKHIPGIPFPITSNLESNKHYLHTANINLLKPMQVKFIKTTIPTTKNTKNTIAAKSTQSSKNTTAAKSTKNTNNTTANKGLASV